MAYTIKGLAKANECENQDRYGLAEVWSYWVACNSNDSQSVRDFLRLNKKDRKEMMNFMREEYPALANHILDRIDF